MYVRSSDDMCALVSVGILRLESETERAGVERTTRRSFKAENPPSRGPGSRVGRHVEIAAPRPCPPRLPTLVALFQSLIVSVIVLNLMRNICVLPGMQFFWEGRRTET